MVRGLSTRRMPPYRGWDGTHVRGCPLLAAVGTEEDLALHLESCDPETCDLPHSCDCRERDETAYWREVDRRVDEARGKR